MRRRILTRSAQTLQQGTWLAKIRILIGDDHTLFRQGLRKILEDRPDWNVVAEAGDGRQAIQQALETQPDVVLLDVGMPVLNGIEVTRQIVRRLPKLRVLILSMHSDEAYVLQAMQAGARGYLLKDSAATELISAIRAVVAGKSSFSLSGTQVMGHERIERFAEQGMSAGYDRLSDREREVMQLVAEGRTSKDIAELLSIAPSTVETHRAHIFLKLNVHNTAELVLYAVRRGIIF